MSKGVKIGIGVVLIILAILAIVYILKGSSATGPEAGENLGKKQPPIA